MTANAFLFPYLFFFAQFLLVLRIAFLQEGKRSGLAVKWMDLILGFAFPFLRAGAVMRRRGEGGRKGC